MTAALRVCDTCGQGITDAHDSDRCKLAEQPAVFPMRVPQRTSAAYCVTCGMTPPHHWAGCNAR